MVTFETLVTTLPALPTVPVNLTCPAVQVVPKKGTVPVPAVPKKDIRQVQVTFPRTETERHPPLPPPLLSRLFSQFWLHYRWAFVLKH